MDCPDPSDRLLLFRLGRREYALPASEIEGVSESLRVRPVPGTPPEILGLAEWRGRILSVLDLPRLLDVTDDREPACLLRLAAPFQFCALRLPGSVRLVRNERRGEPEKRPGRLPRSDELTLLRADALMGRVGIGSGGTA